MRIRVWQAAFLLLLILLGSSVKAEDVSGTPLIVDGDTLWIDSAKIRLHGIDAPEMKQKCHRNGTSYLCGQSSTEALRSLIGENLIRCQGSAKDRYGRLIAVCYAGDHNLNMELVRQGWALAYRRYSKDFVEVEEEAQQAKRGMWAGEFRAPWEWRRKRD